MDLHAILNASDSSDGFGEGSNGDLSSNIDLEDILREDDDDDDDDDDVPMPSRWEKPKIQSTSTINYRSSSASWKSKSDNSNNTGRPPPSATTTTSSLSSKYKTTVSSSQHHNPDDWAVLQQILNEDDYDDDNDDDWMGSIVKTPSSNSPFSTKITGDETKIENLNINALVDSDDESDMEDEDISHFLIGSFPSAASPQTLTSMKAFGSSQYPTMVPTTQNNTHTKEEKVEVPDLVRTAENQTTSSKIVTADTNNFADGNNKTKNDRVSHIGKNSASLLTTGSRYNRLLADVEEDQTEFNEELYRRSLSQAQAMERKLLKSGHREIVSPLMVKRRLKPKIELRARFDKHTKRQPISKVELLKNERLSSAPRFSFSGIVENKTMTGVSASLVKHADPAMAKVLCGLPTCLAFNSKFIAIGTQMGIILIFDLFEVLRQRLGASSFDDSPIDQTSGSITSIDLSQNGEAVVAGYTSGVLVLWDTIRGIVLRAVTDAHPSPITSVRFLTELKMVTVDAGGLVNKLSFSKNLIWSNYSLETECLLDGTAGQILAMNVLAPYSTVKQSVKPIEFAKVLRNLTLIALSSERSSFAVAVDPKINVLHRWAKPPADRMEPWKGGTEIAPDQTYLPCLSWGWALISGGGNISMPTLARAWGCCIQLLCASFPTLDHAPVRIGEEPTIHWPAFGVHKEIDATAPVVSLEWLNERSLVYLTVSNEFTLVDTVMMTLLERLDFTGFKLVYAEFSLSRSARKETSNGDVGVPIACTTFQNSSRSSDDRLMILCQNELRCVSIVGARRRISALEADGEWLEALAFALDHYENTVLSQEDRRRDPDGKKDISKHPEFSTAKSDEEEWIAKLLVRYLNLAVENAPESAPDHSTPYSNLGSSTRIDLAQSHFQMLAGVCVEFCVVTRRLDLLFGPIFRRFQNVGYIAVFLDVLEPYVLNDKLSYIAPEVMSFFVEHCKATNGISTVERCLLHMDCTIMDFDSILALLRSNEMYSALFYVFNNGLDDYVTPLEILLEKVFNEADAGAISLARQTDDAFQNDFERLGYKAILYLHTSFNGKTFPQETRIEDDAKVFKLKMELLKFLFQDSFSPSTHVKRPINLLPAVGQRSLPFPYLRILLLVDPRGILDALSIALDSADSFRLRSRSASESVDGWVDGSSNRGDQSTKVLDIQEMMVDLAYILLPRSPAEQSVSEQKVFQARGAVHAFLDFAAKYIMDGIVKVEKSITLMIFARVSKQFSSAKDSSQRQSYQRKAMDILSAIPRDSYDPDMVLGVLNNANMHRASLLLHQQVASSWLESGLDDIHLRSRHFLSAIDCYIGDDDPIFRMEVFNYVKKECSGVSEISESNQDGQPRSLREALFDRLSALVHLDALMTARLVAELFVDEIDHVIAALKGDDNGEGQFRFLKAIISGELVEVDPVAGSVLNLTMEHHQKYLELMAKLHPELVYDYLASHDNYRTEECLRLCEQYDIADASSYLLERMGNVSSALQLILQTLETRMMGLKRTIRGIGVDLIRHQLSRTFVQRRQNTFKLPAKQEKELEGVRRILIVALDVCERNSGSFNATNERDSKFTHGELWFNVLDRLINAKGFLRLSKEQPEHAKIMSDVLSDLLRLTMQRMVSSVPLTDLVRKVTADHSGSRIGELREMVEGLLATYGFELRVFKGAVTVFQNDVHSMRGKQLEMQKEGTLVHTVLNVPLKKSSKIVASIEAQNLMVQCQDSVLQVGPRGGATVAETDRYSYSRRVETGLIDAMKRLRSRRGGESRSSKASAEVSLMTTTDQMYQTGELEPVLYGERPIGALGNAEHRGRLMTFY